MSQYIFFQIFIWNFWCSSLANFRAFSLAWSAILRAKIFLKKLEMNVWSYYYTKAKTTSPFFRKIFRQWRSSLLHTVQCSVCSSGDRCWRNIFRKMAEWGFLPWALVSQNRSSKFYLKICSRKIACQTKENARTSAKFEHQKFL